MYVVESSEHNTYGIISLLINLTVIVFLIVSAIYFWQTHNANPPSTGQSLAMFWGCIIISILCLILMIYGIYSVFSHNPYVIDNPQNPINPNQQNIPMRQGIPMQQGISMQQGIPNQQGIPALSTQYNRPNMNYMSRPTNIRPYANNFLMN
jgi:heme/copper-type cytochrome/quinol oxidase subunit 2